MAQVLTNYFCKETFIMKSRLLMTILATLVLLPSVVVAQKFDFTFKASRVLMDSTWDRNNEPVTEGIIGFYKPEMDR